MYEQVKVLQETLVKARKYVQMAHDDTHEKVYTYGDTYMDSVLYETMVDTEALLDEIDYIRRQKI